MDQVTHADSDVIDGARHDKAAVREANQNNAVEMFIERVIPRQPPELLIWTSWYRLKYIQLFIGPKW